MKFCWVSPKRLFCMQIKLELLSPDIVSALEKELLSHFTVIEKSALIVQTDGRITTDRPLYTGHSYPSFSFFKKYYKECSLTKLEQLGKCCVEEFCSHLTISAFIELVRQEDRTEGRKKRTSSD